MKSFDTVVFMLMLLIIIIVGVWVFLFLWQIFKVEPEVIERKIIDRVSTYKSRMDFNDKIKEMINNGKAQKIYDLYSLETKDNEMALVIVSFAYLKDIPIHILFSIAKVESNYHPRAVGYNGNDTHDLGLFQLNSQYHKFPRTKLFDISFNTKRASDFLIEKYEQYGNWEETILAYNAGNTNKVYNSSVKYLAKVLEYERALNRKFIEVFDEPDGVIK